MGFRRNLVGGAIALALSVAPTHAAPVAAQSDAEARAQLLVPLSLGKIDDLDFGTLITSGSGGTVALNPATGVRTFAGGVAGVASAPSHRAYFEGTGTGGQQVMLTLIPPAQLTSSNGDTIDVLALTLDNGGNPVRTIDPATRNFFVGVGGILMLSSNQPDGDYSAAFQLIANYQ